MIPKDTSRTVGIAAALTTAVGALAGAAVIAALLLGYRGAKQASDTLRDARAAATLDQTAGFLISGVDGVVGLAQALRQAVDDGRLEPGTPAFAETVSVLLKAVPQATRLRVATPGRLTRWAAADPYHPVQMALDSSMPGPTEVPRWLAPTLDALTQQPEIAFETPLRRNGQVLGRLTVTLTLNQLSTFLRDLPRPAGQVPFILYGRDIVVAHPALAGQALRELPTRALLADPHLEAFPPHWMEADRALGRVQMADGTIAAWRTMNAGTDEPWVIGSYYQGDLIADQRAGLIMLAAVGGVILLVAMGAAWVLSRRFARPVEALAEAARQIAIDGPEAAVPLPQSGLRELRAASEAFATMRQGLAEREQIRDLFGRYVPRSVVDTLLTHDGAIGIRPERRTVTPLFTDLQGWTSLAETLAPEQVTEILNAYFAALSDEVTAAGGIIVDFIGDSLFALFGAPNLVPDHAAQALKCALALDRVAQKFSQEQAARGIRLGVTRIGVHSGLATVGSFGAAHRLKYDAAGDVVNAASRLEGTNKVFGTRLLVSRIVLDQTPPAPDWVARPVAQVRVVGRDSDLDIWEVSPLPPTWGSDWIDIYTALATGTTDALDRLTAYAHANPSDGVAARLLLEAGKVGPGVNITLSEK
ncbi:MAG: adenylate/guanylate cyclase domain-containing protein [Elstera sp.]